MAITQPSLERLTHRITLLDPQIYEIFYICVFFRSVYLSEDFRDLGKMFHMDLKTEIKEGEEATLYPAIEQH